MYFLKSKHKKLIFVHPKMLKNKTLLCISNSTCHTVYANKHISCLIYGRVLTKASNYVGTWNVLF